MEINTYGKQLSDEEIETLKHRSFIVALAKVGACLKPEAAFYASFFLAPRTACFEPLLHSAEKIETFYDQDPYHYAYEEISWMAAQAGLESTLIGEWEHPRGQQMLKFTLPLSL